MQKKLGNKYSFYVVMLDYYYLIDLNKILRDEVFF